MKRAVFVNDKMVINTGHKLFDKQTNVIMIGNVIANTQISSYVRGALNCSCNGKDDYEPEHLRDFDLKWFHDMPTWVKSRVREITDNIVESVIVYEFAHHYPAGKKQIHGYIVTDSNHEFLKMWVVGRSYKSVNVLYEVRKYICNGFEDQ